MFRHGSGPRQAAKEPITVQGVHLSGDERRERLCPQYTMTEFNNVRLRTFNGDHLTLPGESDDPVAAAQRTAVWRILQTPNCLLAHVVGAGKTYDGRRCDGMKRLGRSQAVVRRPQSHARAILIRTSRAVSGRKHSCGLKGRILKETATLMSRIATGNWDAVIVTHSGFEKTPVARNQEEFINAELRELSLAVEHQRKNGDSRIVKQLERAKKKLESKLKELAANEKKDDTLTFEELGIDRLFVDEAHYFKNLFTSPK